MSYHGATMMTTQGSPQTTHDPLITDLSRLSGNWAILGGTFDPPTNGHIALAQALLDDKSLKLEGILFIPARQNPLKPNAPLASDKQRIEMLRIALKSNPKLYVSPLETQREGVSYTIDTLREIAKVAKSVSLRLVMGADQLSGLHNWKEYREILKLAPPIMVGRNGVTSKCVHDEMTLGTDERALLAQNFIEFDYPGSASDVRRLFQAGQIKEGKKLVEPSVLEYIKLNGLYPAN